jgi:cell wall-associated NlpC family hydrolase
MASVLNPKQARFVSTLSQLSGLDPHVVSAWTLAEESGGAAAQRAASGNMNWLNYSAGTGPGGRFDHPEWKTPEQAATAIAKELKTSSFYKGIAATAGKSPAEQLAAISASPWDVAHYKVSGGLTGTYKLVSGQDLKLPSGATTQAQVPGTPKVAQNAPPQQEQVSPFGLTPGNLLAAAKQNLGVKQAQSGISFIEQALGQSKDPTQQGAPLPGGGFSSVPVNKLKFSTNVGDSTALSPSGKGIVQAALKFKGTPYSWGGGGTSGPSKGIAQGSKTVGFDCSALLQYSVYQATGQKIPRVAQDQYAAAKPVDLQHAKPGDAVFFGTKKNVHHVGIYLGDGKMIDAPHTGTVVRVESLAGRTDVVGYGRF